jgi:hypothetical protein
MLILLHFFTIFPFSRLSPDFLSGPFGLFFLPLLPFYYSHSFGNNLATAD